jgi:hypothetical protein
LGLITGTVSEPFGFGSSRVNVGVGVIALIVAAQTIVSVLRRRR